MHLTPMRIITALLLVMACALMSSPAFPQASNDPAVLKARAEMHIKQIDKQRAALQKRMNALLRKAVQSKYSQTYYQERSALERHKEVLSNEKNDIRQVLHFVDNFGSRAPEGKRDHVRELNLRDMGTQFALGLPRQIEEIGRVQEQARLNLQQAMQQGRVQEEIRSLERAVTGLEGARAAAERSVIVVADYVGAVGASSFDYYRAQWDAGTQRLRMHAAKRMSPDDAGAIVLGALALMMIGSQGSVDANQLNAERQSAKGRCLILGGNFMEGTGSEVGTCSR